MSGKPVKKEETKAQQPKSIYYDVIEREKERKNPREETEDQNYLMNKSIARNLHYFFSAFTSFFETDEHSPTFSRNFAEDENSPGLIQVEDKLDSHMVKQCIYDILIKTQMLLETQDRELLHHVLFCFKNYHESIIKIEVWQKMSDDIRDLYASIVRVKLRDCEKVLELSWRYHVTYIKVLETIIDSQYDHNNEVMEKKQLDIETMNRLYNADKSLQGFIQPEK